MKSARTIVSALAILLLASCSGSGGPLGPTTPGSITMESVEFASFELVNKERADTSVDPRLIRQQAVAQIARQYSERMRDEGFFSHTDPDGHKLGERLRTAGIQFRSAAENLAKVSNAADPAAYAHTLLMQHSEHRENILGGNFELLGVGAARGNGSIWITQIFIER